MTIITIFQGGFISVGTGKAKSYILKKKMNAVYI